jgi:hypothetical protein
MHSQYQKLFLAIVRQILHRNLKKTNMYVVPKVSFGYRDLCYVGTVAPMCCNSAWRQAINSRSHKYRVWICDEEMFFIPFFFLVTVASKFSSSSHVLMAWLSQHPLMHHPKNLILGFHGWDETIPHGSIYLVSRFFFSSPFFPTRFFP